MAGFYVLIVLGICVFTIINIFLGAYGILQTSLIIAIILEIMALWICFGPQLILYYILQLKNNLESYSYLYEQYEEVKNNLSELEKTNMKEKKQYKETLIQATNVPYKVIENQKENIFELVKLRDELKATIKTERKEKEILKEENEKLKEENQKLKQYINKKD